MNHQNANPTNAAPLTVVEVLKQPRSSLVTLVAGVAILILSAASGYVAHEDGQGIDWLELSIYLCAVVLAATQGGRLLRACVGLAKRPVQWMRTRSGGGTDGK